MRSTIIGTSAGRTLVGALMAVFALIAAPPSPASAASLQTLQRSIVERYPGVKHVTAREFTQMQAGGTDILLIDVREIAEFTVSRLSGAARMQPGMWTSTFLRKFGDRVDGRTVVFYCSVGQRSSYAASYLQGALRKRGASDVVNLTGGIFNWHNQSRPLTDAGGATDFIHPYDRYWARYIKRSDKTRYAAR